MRPPRRTAWLLCLFIATVQPPAQAAGLPAAAISPASTQDITLDGRLTLVDLYAPPRPSNAAIVLAHGFMRSRATFAGHAAALASEGVLAVVPDLPYVSDSRKNARALIDLVGQLRAGALGPPVERVVLVGFSAGGLAALLAAHAPGVVGYVGLDAFDRPGGVGLEAARRLDTPALLLRGPSAFCNAYAIAGPWSAALKNLVAERTLAEASHCDFESPTDRMCELFCGRADAARQAIVRDTLREAVQRWLLTPASASSETRALIAAR